jgi:hypothetical protein
MVRWPPTLASDRNRDSTNWLESDANTFLLAALTCADTKACRARIDELEDEIAELKQRASDLMRAIASRGGAQGYGTAPPAAILGVVIANKARRAA